MTDKTCEICGYVDAGHTCCDDTDERHIDPADALRAAGLPVRPCGLNADWSVRAWHLGPSTTPNMVSGDLYLTHDPVDRHDACAWYVVQRTLDLDTGDMSDDVISNDGAGAGVTLDDAITLAVDAMITLALVTLA